MHFVLYVCLPRAEARSSAEARAKVWAFLDEEHFCGPGRFCGMGDYFVIGGRYSGALQLLRLKHEDPRRFARFVSASRSWDTSPDGARLFRKTFPQYRGAPPVARQRVPVMGRTDDAQVMDDVLYDALRRGFDDGAAYRGLFDKPSVIFTDLDSTEWRDRTNVVGKQWVVVIDFHD